MALEQLAVNDVRPVIDRVRVTTGLPTASPLAGFSASTSMYVAGRGLLCVSGSTRCMVAPDGVFAPIAIGRFGNEQVQLGLCGLGGRRWYCEYERQRRNQPDSLFNGHAYALSPVTLQGATDLGAVPFNIGGSPEANYGPAALLPDGAWLVVGFGNDRLGPGRYVGGVFQIEADMPAGAGSAFFSWAEHDDEIWICGGNGSAVRYDFVRRVFVGPVLQTGLSNSGLFYMRKHGVLLSISGSSGPARTYVHALTPRPDRMEQTVAPPPRQGRVSRVRTRLLGSYNEPCEGEAVQWTAPAGYQIVPVQPVTDADGYALADLIVPFGMTGGGSVTAEVVI